MSITFSAWTWQLRLRLGRLFDKKEKCQLLLLLFCLPDRHTDICAPLRPDRHTDIRAPLGPDRHTDIRASLSIPRARAYSARAGAHTTVYVCACTHALCIALHCTALHCIALHCSALHCIVLHCTALHCIALHCLLTYMQTCMHICIHLHTVHIKGCRNNQWSVGFFDFELV